MFSFLSPSSHYTVTTPNAAPYPATLLITLSHLDLYACAFRTHPTHRTASHRTASHRNSLSAAGPTPEEPRDEERTWKPATLLQSYSSPELPVSPDESFASSCSLRNARNDRQLSANRCSLPDPSFATVSGLPERTVIGYRGRGRKYERSRSEVTLLSSVELCGEFRGKRQTQRGEETHVGVARGRNWSSISAHENSLSSEISNVAISMPAEIILVLRSVSNVSDVTFRSLSSLAISLIGIDRRRTRPRATSLPYATPEFSRTPDGNLDSRDQFTKSIPRESPHRVPRQRICRYNVSFPKRNLLINTTSRRRPEL